MQNGWWDVTLRTRPPEALLRALMDNPWGEVYITSRRFPTPFHTKAGLKAVSQFTGVLWSITKDPISGNLTIAGPSNSIWLGDPDRNRGDLRKTMLRFTAQPVATAVTSLLPVAVTAGTIQSPSVGLTVNTKHYLEPAKSAIQMIADLTGGEWRVNPNGTLDFGSPTQLGYTITPTCLVYPRDIAAGGVPRLAPSDIRPLHANKMETLLDVQDYITEALILGEGGGETIALGEATVTPVPYNDPNGNDLIWRETFDIPILTIDHADDKAQQVVDEKAVLRQALSLDMADFAVEGRYGLGDYLYVFEPPMIQDPANPTPFGSGYIYPAAIRLVALDWGISEGMGVYFRDHTDAIYDLSDLVEFDNGEPRFEVGEFRRSAINTSLAGSIAIGRGTTNDDDDQSTPAQVATFAEYAEGVTYSELGGYLAWQEFTWDPVTTNSDASSMVDGDRYSLRYGEKALIDAGGVYSFSGGIPLGEVSGSPSKVHYTVRDLKPATQYYFAVRCIDLHGNRGAWSTTITLTTPTSTAAPGTPPTPVVTSLQSGNIKVTIDLADGTPDYGVTNPDISYFRLFYGTATSPTTEVAQIPVTYQQLIGGQTIAFIYQVPEDDLGGTVYVRLKAVTHAGVMSASYSSEDSTVAVYPNDYYGLPNARDNLVPDPSFESGPDNHPTRFTGTGSAAIAITADATYPRCGAYAIKYNPATAKGTTNIWPNGQSTKVRGWPTVFEGQQVYFAFFVRKQGSGTTDRVRAGIRFIDSVGTALSTTYSSYYTPTTTYARVEVTATADADAVAVQFLASKPDDGYDEILWFDDFYARIVTQAAPEGTVTEGIAARLAPEVAWWIDRQSDVAASVTAGTFGSEAMGAQVTIDAPAWVNNVAVIIAARVQFDSTPASTRALDIIILKNGTTVVDAQSTAWSGTATPDDSTTNSIRRTTTGLITVTAGASFTLDIWIWTSAGTEAVTSELNVVAIGYA
jgi:hypothetical protein